MGYSVIAWGTACENLSWTAEDDSCVYLRIPQFFQSVGLGYFIYIPALVQFSHASNGTSAHFAFLDPGDLHSSNIGFVSLDVSRYLPFPHNLFETYLVIESHTSLFICFYLPMKVKLGFFLLLFKLIPLMRQAGKCLFSQLPT